MAKIIIAEDDPVSRRLLQSVVERAGHTAILSSDGRRALGIIRDNPEIVCIIADHEMPGMSGLQLLEELRSDPEYLSIPVILVSGVISLKQINELLLRGATRFLAKPIEVKMLTEYIARLVDAEEARRRGPIAEAEAV